MNLNWEKYTLYIIIGYGIYYLIIIGLDMMKRKRNSIIKDDGELMDVECLIEEVPSNVENIAISEELKTHNEKKNYFKNIV